MRARIEDAEYVRYFGEIDRYPLLTPDEEHALAKRARDGDRSAVHGLVTSNLRFVVKIALEYRSDRVRVLDLVQEGTLGLLRAIELFDPDRGVRLLTYGVHWIRAYVRAFIARQASIVRRPERSAAKTTVRDVSLTETIGGDDGQTLEELLKDEHEGPAELVLEADRTQAAKDIVGHALDKLGERDRYILHRRLLAEPESTLQEIGDTLGLSRERVRQLEARAKQRLGRALSTLAPELVAEVSEEARPTRRPADPSDPRRRPARARRARADRAPALRTAN